MSEAIEQLKRQAKRLHKRVRNGDPPALDEIRQLPEFRGVAPSADEVQLKHCLTAVGRRLGFSSWAHAQRVLRGDGNEPDFGTLLYPRAGAAFTNQWFADYAEARRARELGGGYLLAYKRQFVVVTHTFIEVLGLDPADPDWDAMGRDWVRPANADARGRLYATLVRHRLAA